ncbi:SGNH/GDSL hydrolase family protein [Chlorogloeopsis sp. ULAP01]|uniref:SGNH/GDSL hydrolase family protein n=1 Tax=Chlorogloeopsis sp. ULAP01 TaxID=3056483 RepID=UPI0025AB47D7|nr:SGNH/GDSL hydrolase family protein [Chlorogloeopsis sp. ULAP01]MDM9379947.1 SGNH/GDSL hydrolase family protein [Chlorogloeopsis sp. ULAP01]
MKKLIFLVALTFATLIMVVIASHTQGLNYSNKINELYVFGDSLSDIGNRFKNTGRVSPPSPPYFQGRYSNGPVWVEYLSSNLGLNNKQINNFAYGGATTLNSTVNDIPGVLAQVYSFTKAHQKVNTNALYILWAGANDYLSGVADSTASVSNLSNAIQSLVTAGAKNILIANLPDLGKLPVTRNSPYSSSLSSVTSAHNRELAKSLNFLSQKLDNDTHFIELDVSLLYREAIANPAKFGFTNVTSPCVNNFAVCDNPDEFLFWDDIHPTTVAHRILGEAALKELKIAY